MRAQGGGCPAGARGRAETGGIPAPPLPLVPSDGCQATQHQIPRPLSARALGEVPAPHVGALEQQCSGPWLPFRGRSVHGEGC